MTTQGRQSRTYARVLLYGCSHKPKFSAYSLPKFGEEILCHPCNRARVVAGFETEWKYAVIKCQSCPWRFSSETAGKKRILELAHKHADAASHSVAVDCDGTRIVVKAKIGNQLKLIDDLLMPD